jgi:hypothetical protein
MESQGYFTRHFIIEGMTEASIINAEMKKTRCTEFRNLSTTRVEITDETNLKIIAQQHVEE